MRLFSVSVQAVLCGALVSGLVGCGTPKKAAPAEAGTPVPGQGKGHWVTLPAATGTHIPRRVWVAEDGKVTGTGSDAQNVSAKAMEDMQRRGAGAFKTRD